MAEQSSASQGQPGRWVEVVTLGEVLGAFVASDYGPLAEATRFERHVAGAEANTAVTLARLDHAVAFVGRVGSDGIGLSVRRRLRAEGIDVGHLAVDPGAPTGILIRDRRGLGPSEVTYHRTDSAGSRLSPDDVEEARRTIAAARWLHVTGITPALSESGRAAVERAIELASDAGVTVSLDLNVRRKLWDEDRATAVLRGLAARVDVVLAGDDEARLVAGVQTTEPAAVAASLLELGSQLVVLKLGAAGAMVVERGGQAIRRPALPVRAVVDPVGAGDAFCGGFIAARLDGAPLERCLDVANACGAATVAALGDMTGSPTTDELERLLATSGPDVMR